MNKARTYSKFVPNTTINRGAKWLDWEMPDPPKRTDGRMLNAGERGIAWVIRATLQETSGGYDPDTRQEAWRWIMWEDDPNTPWTFSWCCTQVGLNVKWVIDTWEAGHGKIYEPTEADRAHWASSRNKQRRSNYRRKMGLTGKVTDGILPTETEGS